MPGLDGQVENEHFCLQLAQRLDFTVSRTEVLTIAGEKAIAVERFDRFPWKLEDGTTEWRRIHQEDMCQALSVMPDRKYQADGGPNIKAILRLLAERSTAPEEDTYAFTRAVGMNFLIAGTDAHAKNFSVLILPGAERSEIRLAPLYDINSALPYYDDLRDVELSLSIDGRKAFGDIMRRHWEAEARASRLYADRVVAELRIMMAALPRVAQETLEACRKDGLGHPMLDLLVQRLTERCRKLEKLYGFRN
jgi:serine/threonine-protein kinase HipA